MSYPPHEQLFRYPAQSTETDAADVLRDRIDDRDRADPPSSHVRPPGKSDGRRMSYPPSSDPTPTTIGVPYTLPPSTSSTVPVDLPDTGNTVLDVWPVAAFTVMIGVALVIVPRRWGSP